MEFSLWDWRGRCDLTSSTPGPSWAPSPPPLAPLGLPLPRPLSRGERGAMQLEKSKLVLLNIAVINVCSLLYLGSPSPLGGGGKGEREPKRESDWNRNQTTI